MRVAFYAPLKTPAHPVPSGDRRMARLLVSALRAARHEVEVASELRALDRAGDASIQKGIRDAAEAEAKALIANYLGRPPEARPAVWFTYHVYYKAPDWLGPRVSEALGIPYVTAEASYAEKRAEGPWALGHEQTRAALLAADAHVCLTRFDRQAIERLLGSEDRLVDLPPFLEAAPDIDEALQCRARAEVCAAAGFDPTTPIIATVAMMRPGDKAQSYAMLARALEGIRDLGWNLVIVGDGDARAEVETAFADIPAGRVFWAGAVAPEEVGAFLAAADIYAWPAHNEAYGMAFLEAQAWGVPVVAQETRGVPDVVEKGISGLLTPEGDAEAFRDALVVLIADPERRAAMGRAARAFIRDGRTLERASAILDRCLRAVTAT